MAESWAYLSMVDWAYLSMVDAILQPPFWTLYYGVDELLKEEDSYYEIPITSIRVRYEEDDLSFQGA